MSPLKLPQPTQMITLWKAKCKIYKISAREAKIIRKKNNCFLTSTKKLETDMQKKSQLFWKPLAHTMHHAWVVYTVYLHMPLLHSAFRPHTYQLHSISRSSEAHRLAGLCYITTLHSIYKSPCTKLMCTHTNTQREKKKTPQEKSNKFTNVHSKHENYEWHRHIKPLQSITHSLAETLITSITSIYHHDSVPNALQ